MGEFHVTFPPWGFPPTCRVDTAQAFGGNRNLLECLILLDKITNLKGPI